MRLGPALILIGAGAYLGKRAMDIAREEDKPLGEVLSSLPGRIAEDVKSLPDDLRMAGKEGKLAVRPRDSPTSTQGVLRPTRAKMRANRQRNRRARHVCCVCLISRARGRSVRGAG